MAEDISSDINNTYIEMKKNRREGEKLMNEMKTAVDGFLKRRGVLISRIKVIGKNLKEKEKTRRDVRLVGTGASVLSHGTTVGVCGLLLAGVTVPFATPILLVTAMVGTTGQMANIVAKADIKVITAVAFENVRENLEEEERGRRELTRTLTRIEQLVARNDWLLKLWKPVIKAIQKEEDYIKNADLLDAVKTYQKMAASQEELKQAIDWENFASKHVDGINMTTLLRVGVLLGRIPVGMYIGNIAKNLESTKLTKIELPTKKAAIPRIRSTTKNVAPPKTGLTTLVKVQIGFALIFSSVGLCLDITDLGGIMTEYRTTGNGEKIIQLADHLEAMEKDFGIRGAVEEEG